MTEAAAPDSAEVLNLNVGVLGHVVSESQLVDVYLVSCLSQPMLRPKICSISEHTYIRR